MAKVKNFKNRKNKVSKYSMEERALYHQSRYFRPEKHGIKFESAKHFYSSGFSDGLYGVDNTKPFTLSYGKFKGKVYSVGQKRGNRLAHQYYAKTGKQIDDILRK